MAATLLEVARKGTPVRRCARRRAGADSFVESASATAQQPYCSANPDNCCRKDSLGIPRCLLNANNCTAPIPAGSSCVTSADCCGKPCVDNKCLAACVNASGTCTTNADCCAGLPCVIPTGATTGLCGGVLQTDGGVAPPPPPPPPPDDGGTTADAAPPPPACALYGQSCTAVSCCSGVPCIGGICQYIK